MTYARQTQANAQQYTQQDVAGVNVEHVLTPWSFVKPQTKPAVTHARQTQPKAQQHTQRDVAGVDVEHVLTPHTLLEAIHVTCRDTCTADTGKSPTRITLIFWVD